MKRVLSMAVVLCLSLLTTSCWEEKQPPTWKTATGPEAYEKLFWDEVKAKNWPQVEGRLGATFVAIDSEGRHDRAETMALFRQLDLQDFSLGEMKSEPNGSDMMVTYTIVMHGTYKGQPLPNTPLRMLTVWQQVKGGWIAVAHADVPATNP
ncbi:MAG TPA: nuclear transport factor 2 family protein [Terriglobales bacterium]|nr:nuclear transport factor 2 family protein [Terriglobales bacterium]